MNMNNSNITILVKFISVMLIIYYGSIDIKYGFICCLGIIIYFNLHHKLTEGLETNSNNDPIIDITADMIKSELVGDDDGVSHNSVSNNKIPKRIIQVWKTWSSKNPSMFTEYINSIKSLNPEYDYMFFKDEDIDNFLQKNYPEYYNTYLKLPLNIQKVDFFRYVAIYHYGGFYFDLDMKGLLPLDNLLQYECVFPIDEIINNNMCKNDNRFTTFCDSKQMFLLGQYGFAAKPKHEFIKQIIDNIHYNMLNIVKMYNSYISEKNYENYVYSTTGPDYVTNQYIKYANKSNIKILKIKQRQYFGRYARHLYVGSWK